MLGDFLDRGQGAGDDDRARESDHSHDVPAAILSLNESVWNCKETLRGLRLEYLFMGRPRQSHDCLTIGLSVTAPLGAVALFTYDPEIAGGLSSMGEWLAASVTWVKELSNPVPR